MLGAVAVAFAWLRRKRVAAMAAAIRNTEKRMATRAKLARAVAVALTAANEETQPRRTVVRAMGKWRGSTVQGYIIRGDRKDFHAACI